MNLLKNYWKETGCSAKKIGLAMRGLLGTVAGSGFIQGNVKFAFYVLLAGGILDFILQNLPPDKKEEPTGTNTGNGAAAAVIALLMIFAFSSCSVIKPQVDHSKTDSTYTTYKQVDIKLTGAKVVAGINMDSLYHALLLAKDERMEDSLLNLKTELQYKQDSIAALKAGKPIPAAPALKAPKPVINYVTDPQTKAQLSYWVDQYGKLQLGCESKDQVVHSLQAQVNKLTTDKTTTVKVAYQTPTWNKVVMILEGILLAIAAIFIVFKSII